MDKRKLAKVPIETATEDMLKISAGLKEEYMVTASLIDDNTSLWWEGEFHHWNNAV